MPIIVTTTQSLEGFLREFCVTRTADGRISMRIEILEVLSENGIPILSRVRVFTHEDLTPTQYDALLSLYNSAESRIRTIHYS